MSEVPADSRGSILHLHRLQVVQMGGSRLHEPAFVLRLLINVLCSQIPDSSEGRAWYSYVDENVTPDTLRKLTDEYLQILEKSPSKFKSKMKAITSNGQTAVS